MRKAIELVNIQTEWVEKLILSEKKEQCCPPVKDSVKQVKLKWTGSVVEWVELIYALYLVKRINGGEITLKVLFHEMGKIFDFDVKEFANYFMNIKNRKDEYRTKFMDLLKAAILGKMEEADRKPSRK